MRKFLLMILLAFLCLGCGKEASAGLVEEATLSVDITLEKCYDLEAPYSGEAELESQMVLVGVDIPLGERCIISPRIGGWNCEIDTDTMNIEGSLGLALGLDAQYFLTNLQGGIDLYGVGEYRFADAEVNLIRYKQYGYEYKNPSWINDLDLHAWEIGIRGDIVNLPVPLTPSIGVVLSGSKFDWSNIEGEEDKSVGLRLGVEGTPIPDLDLKLESKLIDETSIVASATYRW